MVPLRIITAAALLVTLVGDGPVASAQRAGGRRGGGVGEAGPGREPSGQRPEPGRRVTGPRGGRAGVTAERIQTRRYRFAATNEDIEYAVFVSSKVDNKKKNPLLIALHGLGVPPATFLRLITDAAQEAGYIVAAPMGYNVRGWFGANGSGGGSGSPANLGELSEQDVLSVLDLMRTEFNIDDRRIYLAGQSMGGAGALFLGLKHPHMWAAVAASAPAIRTRLHTPADLEQALSLPIMLIHGDADRAVPVELSRQWAAKMEALAMTYEYLEIRGGDHGDAIVAGARRMFAFFAKHVKPESK